MSANDATWLLGVLFDASLRIAMAGAGVAVALPLLHIRASGARHAAWVAVLVAMLAMPFLPRLLPPIEVPAGVMSVAVPDWTGEPGAPGRQTRVGEPSAPAAATTTAVERAAPTASSAPASAAPPATASSRPSLSVIVASAWILVALALLTRLLAGWLATRRLRRGALPVALPDDTLVLESSDLAAPVTCGLLRPRVVLPRAWRTWPDAALAAVVAHERAHVRRRDPLVIALAHLNRCVFWFHPLAWWLDRTLARSAEHACDDEAVRASGDAIAYADTLIGMADAVRLRGARVAWLAAGVDGAGGLGERIDRVLAGPPPARISATRAAVLAAVCVAAIGVAAACQRTVAELEPDPELAAELEQEAAERALTEAALTLTLNDVEALEAALATDAGDAESRHKLLVWYQRRARTELSREELTARRLRHRLWLIEHAPMHPLARRWMHISPREGAEAYARGAALWRAHAARPDASAELLGRAAAYFTTFEPRETARLFQLAMERDPQSRPPEPAIDIFMESWSASLGNLYARVIAFPMDHPDVADEFRATLESTSDPHVLAAAGGYFLISSARPEGFWQRRFMTRSDAEALGRAYLGRAATLDPSFAAPRWLEMRHDVHELYSRLNDRLRSVSRDPADWPTVAAGWTPDERLYYLPELARQAYQRGNSALYYLNDEAAARAAWDAARRLAEDAVSLAEAHPDSEWHSTALMGAHLTLGTLGLRDGSRQRAIDHLLQASRIPASDRLAYGGIATLESTLVPYLIKYGERDTVIEYLDRMAELRLDDRRWLQESATALREDRMPESYQRLLFRESQPPADRFPASTLLIGGSFQ